MSEIERGDGSFTAEQFLAILKLFNVPASHFTSSTPQPDSSLQNALARLGAAQRRPFRSFSVLNLPLSTSSLRTSSKT